MTVRLTQFALPDPSDANDLPPTQQIGAMTRALLGSSWLGSFALDSALQQRLFVPSHFSLGPQPVCERYRTEDYAEELSLFRLQTVLYPGWCVSFRYIKCLCVKHAMFICMQDMRARIDGLPLLCLLRLSSH